MGNGKRQSQKQMEPEISYFELQAYMGTTKHMGGFETTQTLIDLCHIDKDTEVLDVGCGVGATACYLARTYGCRVVGIDLRESMVARSNERAVKEGVADRVEFRVADVQALPFEDGRFDVVLCESVATFIRDKQRVIDELARVVRPGGYVGINEELWLKPPPPEVAQQVSRIWDIKPEIPRAEDWVAMFERAGLRDITAKTYRLDPRREASQVKRYSLGDMLRMFGRILVLYVKSADFRAYMKNHYRLPKDCFGYLGYGVFVGRKPG